MRFLSTPERLREERGAVALLVALVMVVLLGSTAIAVDLARLRHERHVLQAAVDLGSLAGAGFLPARGGSQASLAVSSARSIAMANAPDASAGDIQIGFGCLVSDPEGNGGGDSPDLKFACGPTTSGSWASGWTSRDGKAAHACDPFAGDLCNMISVTASNVVDYFFAPAIGFESGNTGAVRASACRGFCGAPTAPLDVVFVIDRTRSMSDSDIANLKQAIASPGGAEDSVLEYYDPARQWVGLVALPYKDPNNRCAVNRIQNYPNTNHSAWQVTGLSSDYRNSDGSLNTSSALVSSVTCLQRAPSNLIVTPSGAGHTDHGDPIRAAISMLATGRPEAPDVIVFFADGESNQPRFSQPCGYANAAASAAKGQGITVFSLGYGAGGKRCGYDTAAPFAGTWATTFLATVASPTDLGPATDNQPGGCASTENIDQDNYFCESRGSDLEQVFRQIAVATVKTTRLINF